MVAMAAADEDLMKGGRGVLPPQICGENTNNHQSYLVKNTLYHRFADNFMGGLLLSHKHSTSRVTPCYTSYLGRNTYMGLGLITVPKTQRKFVSKFLQEPLFPSKKGGFGPLFEHSAPHLRETGFPADFFKKEFPET
jgi:hypothetical protein